jgi:hypothetical protein
MPYDDGRNSARARSARIRASHDYEATHLESMRRRTQETGETEPRVRLLARLAAALRGLRPPPAHIAITDRDIETAVADRNE